MGLGQVAVPCRVEFMTFLGVVLPDKEHIDLHIHEAYKHIPIDHATCSTRPCTSTSTAQQRVCMCIKIVLALKA